MNPLEQPHPAPKRRTTTRFRDAYRGFTGQTITAYHATNARRSREATAAAIRAGYNVGPAPFGYRSIRLSVTTPTGLTTYRIGLVPDPTEAATVVAMFDWRVHEGLSYADIAARLNTDPQAARPRSGHRWSASAVRRVITNPKYTGRQTWCRIIDGRVTPRDQWIISDHLAHEPLISEDIYHCAQQPRTAHPTARWRGAPGATGTASGSMWAPARRRPPPPGLPRLPKRPRGDADAGE